LKEEKENLKRTRSDGTDKRGLISLPIVGGSSMLKPGTRIMMTKGYKGVKGMIVGKTESRFEFYIVKLDNGINIVIGPSAFTTQHDLKENKS
jgi:hypothetical protein